MGLFTRERPHIDASIEGLTAQLEHCHKKNTFYLLSIQVFLYFIKKFSLDLEEIQADRFKSSIDELSKRFTSEEKIQTLQKNLEKYKHIIDSYVDREKEYFDERDVEFKNIIELLTKGIVSISEDNYSFNNNMYNQSINLEKITYLDDIRKIKEGLKQEVHLMKKGIKEKQSRDAKQVEALSREVASLKVDYERVQNESLIDGLTGAYNRAAFDTHLTQLTERNVMTPTAFSLLLLDVDNFKRINDTYGHQVGDRVLLSLVQKCQELVRKDDLLARYGGEEFAILLPGASLRPAMRKARAMCKTIAAAQYTLESQEKQRKLAFTVSIGVSTFYPGDTDASIIARADKALYEAKHQGKNRAVSEKQVS